MDEFEKTIATVAGRVRYQEKVSIPALMRGLLLGSPVLLATSLGTFGAYSGGFHWAVGVAAGLGMGAVAGLANLALMGQRVVVSDHAIDIYVGIRKRTFALSDVVQVERATYRLRDFPLGRGGVKHSLTGDMAFTNALLDRHLAHAAQRQEGVHFLVRSRRLHTRNPDTDTDASACRRARRSPRRST
jgi:uncharacterized membrane protein (UPF0136 family)